VQKGQRARVQQEVQWWHHSRSVPLPNLHGTASQPSRA
jgi:hypothetical protein